MKKIINGKRYDTDTAKEMASASYSGSVRDFAYWEETLYRKSTGEFFLYGEGGPASKYARPVGQNNWSGGERIMPLTLEEAQEWAEKYLDADEYEEIFGEVDEAGEKKQAMFSLSAGTIEKIARLAAAQGVSKSAVIEELVSKA